MAERRQAMAMASWKEKLDAFLSVNEHEILDNAGRVSHEAAVKKALAEFKKWEDRRMQFEASNPVSDFDRLVDKAKRLEGGEL